MTDIQEDGCSKNFLDTNRFFDAIQRGEASAVAERLASDPALVAATQPSNPTGKPLGSGLTALQVAAIYGQTEIARLLIAAGADVNATPNVRSPPLQFAVGAKAHNPELVSLLIASGATIPETILLSAIDWRPDPLKVVESLLLNGADPNAQRKDGVTPLVQAVFHHPDDLALARLLIRHGANVNPASVKRPPLEEAAWFRSIEMVRLLLEAGADINARDRWGNTALHSAAIHGQDLLVELLLRASADPGIFNDKGSTALGAIAGFLQALAILEDAKPAPSIPGQPAESGLLWRRIREIGERGSNPIRFNAAATPKSWKIEGPAAELYRAIAAGDCETVRRLLDSDASLVNSKRGRSTTPLEFAIESGQADIFALLLDRGAPISWRDHGAPPLLFDDHALQSAARYGRSDMLALLLMRGDVNVTEMNWALERALFLGSGDPQTVELLLEAGAEVELRRDFDDLTPLQLACWEGHIDAAEVLIRFGADVNTRPAEKPYDFGYIHDQWVLPSCWWRLQPLCIAAGGGFIRLVDLLLGAGAEINALSHGWSALHLACLQPNVEMVAHLVSRGADVNVKADDGRPLLELLRGFRRSAALLRGEGRI